MKQAELEKIDEHIEEVVYGWYQYLNDPEIMERQRALYGWKDIKQTKLIMLYHHLKHDFHIDNVMEINSDFVQIGAKKYPTSNVIQALIEVDNFKVKEDIKNLNEGNPINYLWNFRFENGAFWLQKIYEEKEYEDDENETEDVGFIKIIKESTHAN